VREFEARSVADDVGMDARERRINARLLADARALLQ
jgi:hypothetical protein